MEADQGLDSLMASGEPARRHLQRRLELFLLLNTLFLGFALIFVELMTLAFARDRFWAVTREPGRVLHAVNLVAVAAVWAIVRRRQLSRAALERLDVAATATMVLLFALDLGSNPPERRPELILVILLSNMLVVRAALVPSTPRRTLALGGFATLAACVAASVISRDPWESGFVIPRVLFVAFLIGMAMVATTLVSRVIYGLRARASQALRLGQYVLERKLGEGGMGVVYRARHAMLKRPTAVKLISPDKTTPVLLARFEREVQLTASLTHPNTIAIFDYGRTSEGTFYYAMEYVDGPTLEELVALDGPQAPGRVVHILSRMCGALAEAHGVGLIHRDIKPANVVLCERGGESDVVKLLDFGLVKRRSAGADPKLSNEDMMIGTPLYIAPESLIAPESVDARADLYAVGAVGYYLLCGEHVFTGATVAAVLADHLHTAPPPIAPRLGREVPDRLEAVLQRCLAKDPAARPPSADALRAELEACGLPWTRSDAAAWWAGHTAARRRRDGRETSSAPGTMTVAMERS
jgi:serine/threonine-protein kinase